MPAGMEVLTDTSQLQFSTEGWNLGMLGQLTVNVTAFDGTYNLVTPASVGYINLPMNADDIVAMSLPTGYYAISIDPIMYASVYGNTCIPRFLTNLPIGTPVTFFIFRVMRYVPASGTVGIDTFDPSANLTWTSRLIPCVCNANLHDGNTTHTMPNGNNTLLGDAGSGFKRTTNSSGQIVDEFAKVTRSGNLFTLSWDTKTFQSGYPPNLSIINLRPNILLIDITGYNASMVPGLPAQPPNASTLEQGAVVRITAGTTTAALKASGVLSSRDTSSSFNSTTGTIQWQYRNITTGSAWADVPSVTHTTSANNTVSVEPPAPPVITFNDTSWSYNDTHTDLTVGHVYEYRLNLSATNGGVFENGFYSVITNATDPSIVRTVDITPYGNYKSKAAAFSRSHIAEILGGTASYPLSWSLSGVSGGGGTMALSGQTGNAITVDVTGLSPQQTKTATLNVTATIDGFVRASSQPIAMRNSNSGATFSEMNNTNELKVANSTSQTFTKTITPTNPYGAPVTYEWFIQSSSGGGTWSIIAGQGTATATFQVTGAPLTTELTCSVYCTISADDDRFTKYGQMRYYYSTTGVYVSNQDPNGGSASSTTAGYTFPAATITVSGGGTPSYAWAFTGTGLGGGSWSISGSGNTRTVQVIGMTSGSFGQRTLRCTVTVDGVDYIRDSTYNYTREGIE